ncbi:SDR family NAD(P)-dependent oxidoreductase [Rhodosalinus sp.]|uniref:SDR family NAD(P)-dependent oxidoreductase n=1 Tax=Rhodosalinus sp. TaxID=2047741 RepID=UPI00356A18C7
MFPGGGAQYVGMARDLYETEPVFADWIDRGLDVLQPKLDYDIRALWLAEGAEAETAARRLTTPSVQLPLIMIVEVALARLFESWGVTPAALIGHSMGENAAACIAGVMRFEDCIGLVHLRGRLMDEAERGGMLSVALPADELRARLGPDLDLGAENAPGLSVASGPQAALDRLQAELAADGIEATRIAIDIAAHSRLLDPVLDRFRDYLRSIPLSPPQIPVISNRTGTWLTAEQATDPDYWVAHLRGTVRFGAGLATLAEEPARLFLEMGPGKALSALARQQPGIEANRVVNALRHPEDAVLDDVHFMGTLGRLWALGARFDWGQIWGEARRNRVVLPTCAFQQAPYFIEPAAPEARTDPTLPERIDGVENWGWRLRWRPAHADCDLDVAAGETGPPRAWLVFADDAGLADRATARLRAGGHTVVEVRPGDAFARVGPDAYTLAPEQGREAYDQLIGELLAEGRAPERIAHFWLVTADESFRPGSSFFHRTQEQGFWSLLFLGQALAGETLPVPPHITVATSGAAQVRDERLTHPEKATAAGPARVIPRELPGVTCAMLDVVLPEASTGGWLRRGDGRAAALDALGVQVLEELLAAPSEHVAALRDGRRLVQTPVPEVLPAPEAPPVETGAAVLITGGFGGIGLTVAERLARDAGARLILVSRSALPPRADWADELARRAPTDPAARRIRAVERLEAAGAEVLPLQADVTNAEDMREVIEVARDRFGRISGVIHAAGVVDDAPLTARTQGSVEEVLAPKLHGTQVLDALFPDGTLDWMVLFSSTSTVTAPAGQVDYVAANEFLNAYARSRAGGRTRVVALDWGVWAEVGMAAEAIARRTGDAPEPPQTAIDAPLLDEATFDGDGHRLLTARWSTAARWVLDEHRTRDGRALLPGSGYPELAAEALAAQGEDGPFEIRDLWFLRPLEVADGADREIRLRLARADEGYAMEVQAAAEVAGRRAWERTAEATLARLPAATPAPLDVAALEERCTRAVAGDDDGLPAAQEAHLAFGPRWRVLTRKALGDREGVARLRLPPAATGDRGFTLHPALMDIATGWAMELIAGYAGRDLWVPLTYGRLRVHRPLPAEIVSWVRITDAAHADAATAAFDVTLAAPDGTVCVEIEGFRLRRMVGGLARPAAPEAREVEFDAAERQDAPLSPAEERLAHNIAQGITPEEGAEAFLRALARGKPQTIVSSLPLDALVKQARTTEATAAPGALFDRPVLEGDYVAPETPTEEALAQIWSALLGVAQVGAEDSFFDLGGHSLIAVRLFARVRKRFGVDLPISVLFEAPTVRACAALIEAETGGAGETAEAATPEAAPAVRRFTHLVPMHEGDGGPKTPFFLAAGMFGNVLNLRHLAHLIGTDRPFYGLQARGLYGGAEPHRDFADAARDMIAEIRQVQPTGPYLLGGFSGGGLTAYEMALQLTEAGEEVGAVVALDTPLPGRFDLAREDRLRIHWQELRRQGPVYPARWIAGKIRYKRSLRAKAEAPAASEHSFHDAEIVAAFHEALAAYDMRPWDGRLALFRPPLAPRWSGADGRMISAERAYLAEDNGWGSWVSRLDVHEVPGDHDSMVLEPNARVLAQRIRRVLDEAEREVAARPAPPTRQAAE